MGNLLARQAGLGGLFFPSLDLALMRIHRLLEFGVFLLRLVPFLQQWSIPILERQQIAPHPGLTGRSTPGHIDEPDRHMDRLV